VDLVRRLSRLSAVGVDAVVITSDGVGELNERHRLRPVGPGAVFVWSGQPAEVFEVAGSGPSRLGPPEPSAPEGVTPPTDGRVTPSRPDPAAWARHWLAGGRDAVLVVGSATSLALVDEVVLGHSRFPAVVDDASWKVDVGGFGPQRETDLEAWLTVANGRTGTRGSLEEGSAEPSWAVQIAGVFGRPMDDELNPEPVPGPEWTRLHPRVDGEAVHLERDKAIEHRRVLDLRQGMVFREWRQPLFPDMEWRFRSARFASLADRDILAIQAEAEAAPELHDTALTLADGIPVPAADHAIDSVNERRVGDRVFVSVRGRKGGAASFAISDTEEGGKLERLVAVSRVLGAGRADGHEAGLTRAEAVLAKAEAAGMAVLRARHRRAWRDRWRDADVTITGDSDMQRALRFALYHLISSGDPEGDGASIGARGLTGPGYRGHVFWDTDVFVLPFFIWTHPPTARALLAYRYRTLPAARAKAARFGYAGALYAWESADTGEEATPDYVWLPDGTRLMTVTGLQEHHISADVAWASWQYWQVHADEDFLVGMGAEMVIETARFWASRAGPGDDGRSHINGVVGPDEYHEGVDDNAYTNVLARWNLHAAAEACEAVRALDASAWRDLAERLQLRPSEPQQWRAVADSLVDGFDPKSLLFEQFAGFFGYENIRAVDLAPRPFTAEMVVGVERLRHSQIVKQPDVLMLAHMLPGVVPLEVAEANYHYYEPRTCHGSSLSPAIHAAVAARVGALDDAARYFALAAGIDLDDRMGNAAKGVHVATMGGLWQAAVVGFGGVHAGDGFLRINPRIPPSWEGLTFPLQWRGTRVEVAVGEETLSIHLNGPATIAVGRGPHARLDSGHFVFTRQGDSWSPVEAADMM